jgi:DNA-binding response OmpR family regulator
MMNRILIVDEDSSVRASVKKVLEQAGYTVGLAANGREAMAELQSDGTGLVLLDLNLPDPDAWEVLEHLTRRSPTVPIVLLTGLRGQTQARELACLAPVLEKPLDAAVLLSTIQGLLDEPREARLRRFCAFLETSHQIPAVGATYLERLPDCSSQSPIGSPMAGGSASSNGSEMPVSCTGSIKYRRANY